MKITPDFLNQSNSPSQRKNAIWFALTIIIIATLIIIRNSYIRFEEQTNQQDNLVKNSVAGAERAITMQISELRRGVKLLAQREENLLTKLANDPEDIDSYDELVNRVKEDFPEAFAVTVANTEGVPYIVDFDGFIVDICKKDIKSFAQHKHPPEIFIHPNPFVYHFDIMVPINLGKRGESFFFVSFKPGFVSRLLTNSQLYNHKLILTKKDRPGLIEITATGSRQKLPEEEFFLSDQQHDNLAYSIPVEGTLWNLVDLPNKNETRIQLINHGVEFATQISILFLLSFFMVRQLSKSERKIIEQNISLTKHSHALKKNEARLERAQKIANMGYWDYNLATDELELSEDGRKIFGITSDEPVTAETIFDLVRADDRQKVKINMAGAIIRKRPYQSTIHIVSKDGGNKVLYASTELTTDYNDNPLHLFGIVQDITKRHIAEEAAKDAMIAKVEADASNKAKSSFLANMSHEIRTPLTAIIGFAETLLQSDQTMTERSNSIKTIIRNGHHLMQVINDILDLSKIEVEKLKIELIPISVFKLISEVDSIIRPMAQDKVLDVQIHYHLPIPLQIVSEPLRLKQILINLLSNAIKFTKQGYVYLSISCNPTEEKMIFSIEDTGIGLTQQQMDKIFDAFTQADLSTTRKYGGTGLGLSLSKQLAKLLGGSLEVTSEFGKGSVFTVEVNTGALDGIVMIDDEVNIPAIHSAQVTSNAKTVVIGKILLAEDMPDNQRLIAMHLNKMGAEVDIAENGQIALDYANDNNYDLILMDVQMPIMDGIQAVKLLRANGYDKPIVALTANAMKEDRDMCLSAGCDDFVTKPVSQSKLAKLVSHYLKPGAESTKQEEPIISELLMEDTDYEDLVNKFVHGLPSLVNTIRNLFENDILDELKTATHKLKGMGSGFGYPMLTDLAAKIEFQQTSQNQEEVKMLIDELESLSKRICIGCYGTTNISNMFST